MAQQTNTNLSDVALENLEALAQSPEGGEELTCYTTYKSPTWLATDSNFVSCYECAPCRGHGLEDKGKCRKN